MRILLFYFNTLEFQVVKSLLDTKNLEECELKYSFEKCIQLIYSKHSKHSSLNDMSEEKNLEGFHMNNRKIFLKLFLNMLKFTKAVGISKKTPLIPINSIVNIINHGTLMSLDSESQGRIFTQFDINTVFGRWILEKGNFLAKRVRNLVTNLYLEANVKDEVFTSFRKKNSQAQEWIFDFDEQTITNRKYGRLLYANLDGRVSIQDRSSNILLSRWVVRLSNSTKEFEVSVNRSNTPNEITRLKNEFTQNYLTSDIFNSLYLDPNPSSGTLWALFPSRGIYVSIRKLDNNMVLDLDVNDKLKLSNRDFKSATQEWFFDEDQKLINRFDFRALTATNNGSLFLSGRSKNSDRNELQIWIREPLK